MLLKKHGYRELICQPRNASQRFVGGLAQRFRPVFKPVDTVYSDDAVHHITDTVHCENLLGHRVTNQMSESTMIRFLEG